MTCLKLVNPAFRISHKLFLLLQKLREASVLTLPLFQSSLYLQTFPLHPFKRRGKLLCFFGFKSCLQQIEFLLVDFSEPLVQHFQP